ncbi:hypothetical protein R6Q57_008800 [Mikania cordata]
MVKINKMMLQAVGRMKQLQDLKSFDLVFFPILEGNHFYVIVFKFTNPAIYLLDNMHHGVSPVTYKDDSDYHKKSTPYKVKHFMMLYLRQWKNPKVERLLMESIQPVQLEWATTDNVTDCGIFTMRHMEMFIGSYKKFECGFKKVESHQKKQINTLRKKHQEYFFQLLMCIGRRC